jgi:hypothetical protein
MTPAEKLSFLHGGTDPASLGQAGYIPGVARLPSSQALPLHASVAIRTSP